MTICIAAICEQGSSLILTTDSMITNEGLLIQFEHPTLEYSLEKKGAYDDKKL